MADKLNGTAVLRGITGVGKNLLHELKQYIRCLWPYAIALVVMGAVACLVVLLDRNSVEATGSMSAIGLFIITGILFVIRGVAHGYKAFSKSLTLEKTERTQPINQFLWTHICAFMIFIVVTALLLLALVSTFAWKFVGQIFLSLNTNWGYFLEFVLYTIIFTVTVYIVPLAMITAKHFSNRKKLVFSVGIITLIFCAVTTVPEALFLIHDTSTDVQLALATVISLLVIFIIVNIWLYLLTFRKLKTEFHNISNDGT